MSTTSRRRIGAIAIATAITTGTLGAPAQAAQSDTVTVATTETAATTATTATAATTTDTATNAVPTVNTIESLTHAGAITSPDGTMPQLPMANGNPYNIKVGDTVQVSNFRRTDVPICFYGVFCTLKPNVDLTVTEVVETKQGTRFKVNGFAGYMGHPVFKNGALIGVTKGSNGGLGYGYLFPTAEAAAKAQPNYKPLRTGLFSRASFASTPSATRPASGSSSSSMSSSSTSRTSTATAEEKAAAASRAKDYAAAHPQGWTKQGSVYLDSVRWVPGSNTFIVDPKSKYASASFTTGLSSLMGSSGNTAGSVPVEPMWREAVRLGVPDDTSLKQQFICHAQGSAIRKDDWKLEYDRPAAGSQAELARAMCNPLR